jgi:hypothetical protein
MPKRRITRLISKENQTRVPGSTTRLQYSIAPATWSIRLPRATSATPCGHSAPLFASLFAHLQINALAPRRALPVIRTLGIIRPGEAAVFAGRKAALLLLCERDNAAPE